MNNFTNFSTRYVTVAKATIYYFLPLSIIGFLYTLMALKLQKSAEEVQNIAGCRKSPQVQNRKHVARMVIVFILGKFNSDFKCNLIFLSIKIIDSFHHLLSTTLDFSTLVLVI